MFLKVSSDCMFNSGAVGLKTFSSAKMTKDKMQPVTKNTKSGANFSMPSGWPSWFKVLQFGSCMMFRLEWLSMIPLSAAFLSPWAIKGVKCDFLEIPHEAVLKIAGLFHTCFTYKQQKYQFSLKKAHGK